MVPIKLGDHAELMITRTSHGWALQAVSHGAIVGVVTSTNDALSRLVRGQQRSIASHTLELLTNPEHSDIEVRALMCEVGRVPRRQLGRILEIDKGTRAPSHLEEEQDPLQDLD